MHIQLFLVACYILSTVTAFPNGAGKAACDNYLLPDHRHSGRQILARTEESPFQVSVHGGGVIQAGSVVGVTLRGPRHFKGFLLVAATYTEKESYLVGEFLIDELHVAHTTPICGGTAVTHTYEWNNSTLDSITFYWKSPEKVFSGPVVFHATFVEDYFNFWVSVNGDSDVFVAHEMSGNFIPPQEGEETTTKHQTEELNQSTDETSTSSSSTTTQTESTFESTSIPTTIDQNQLIRNSQSRQNVPLEDVNESTTTEEIVTEVTSSVADRAAGAMDPAKTTIRPKPTGGDECQPSDMKCLKRKVVSGIHNLIMSLEQIQNHISPTSAGSTSSRQ